MPSRQPQAPSVRLGLRGATFTANSNTNKPESAPARLRSVTSRVAGVLVLVTLLAAGCTLNPKKAASSSPTASPSKLTWIGCGGCFQCSAGHVPLDDAHPEAWPSGT